MPYRTSLVRMYYAIMPKKATPEPFAEFRVYVITRYKIGSRKAYTKMIRVLNRLEYLFMSLREARGKGKIYYVYSIEGSEVNKNIDDDEALIDLAKTGLEKPRYNEIYRFVKIMKMRAGFEKMQVSYNEAMIREIAPPEIAFEDWYKTMVEDGVMPEHSTRFEELWGEEGEG